MQQYKTKIMFNTMHRVKVIMNIIIYILSIICTSYLLLEDIMLFLSKPTYSSNSEEKLQPKNYPNILVCPFPSYDLSQLKKHGYLDAYSYCKGDLQGEGEFTRGWCGKSNKVVEDVIDDISVLKSIKDCPKMEAFFKKEDHIDFTDWKSETIHFEMTKLLNPHGRCCQAKIPRNANKRHVIKVCFPIVKIMITHNISIKDSENIEKF